MRDLDTLTHHPKLERLGEILCHKTQTTDPQFYRIQICYYLAKVASMMRCKINTIDRGEIPVSMYAINLAPSGHGKGHSTNIIEEQVIQGFKERFLESTFPEVSDKHLHHLANIRAMKSRQSPQSEYEDVAIEFEEQGTLAFSFDSATPAAIKQMRHKLLMANAGSMNMEIDEIGSNLFGQIDSLTLFLELYDVGKTKPKLIKNTKENKRTQEIDGRTPTNMMLFGTPTKLLDSAKTEEEFYSMLDTGYARRCVFGFDKSTSRDNSLSPAELLIALKDKTADTFIEKMSGDLAKLAEVHNFNIVLDMFDPVTLLSLEYKQRCELIADTYPDHDEMRKAEISHRYFKALKLAGAFAFLDQTSEVTEDQYYYAIKMVEDSGKAFDRILSRDRNYVRLAKYIADARVELTHADIMQDLPFYKGGENHKRELMNLAIAWGYKNNIIIKKLYNDEIEFLKGEALEETNLDKLVVSYSQQITEDYTNAEVAWHELDTLTQQPDFHFVVHHLLEDTKNV